MLVALDGIVIAKLENCSKSNMIHVVQVSSAFYQRAKYYAHAAVATWRKSRLHRHMQRARSQVSCLTSTCSITACGLWSLYVPPELYAQALTILDLSNRGTVETGLLTHELMGSIVELYSRMRL